MSISPKRLEEMRKAAAGPIDTSDIPELDREWFAKARLVTPAERKHQMTIRIDGDVIEWFKAQGKGYQTHMNAVLREYVKAQRK
jgi:uncharacterized protein (DUF4415 family)